MATEPTQTEIDQRRSIVVSVHSNVMGLYKQVVANGHADAADAIIFDYELPDDISGLVVSGDFDHWSSYDKFLADCQDAYKELEAL